MARKTRRSKGEWSVERHSKGGWRVRIDLGYGEVDGKRKRLRKVVYGKTKIDALENARNWYAKHRSGSVSSVSAKRMTLGGLLDRYVKHRADREGIRPTTKLRYEQVIEDHIKPVIGGIKIDRIEPDHLESLYDSIGSPRTRGIAHELIRAAYNKAIRWRLVQFNPCSAVDNPGKKGSGKAISLEEIRLLLRESESDRLHALYVCAITMGIRLGELLALQWSDIDFKAGLIHINKTLVEIPKHFKIGPPKSDLGTRSILMPAAAAKALKEHRKKMLAEGFQNAPVFCTPGRIYRADKPRRGGGAHYRKSNLYRDSWNPLRKATGVQCKFHDLRHTCRHLLQLAKVDSKEAARMLGHNEAVSLVTYSHTSPELQKATVAAVNKALSSVIGHE